MSYQAPAVLRRAILTAHDGLCFYCGNDATDTDHIIAQKHGGTHEPFNLIASCNPCNSRKSSSRLSPEKEARALARALELIPVVDALVARPNKPAGRPRLPSGPELRKSISLTQQVWDEISAFRHAMRISSETEAIRQLISDALQRHAESCMLLGSREERS